MDINYNLDFSSMNNYDLEKIQKYVVIKQELLYYMLNSIDTNYFLILFTMTCLGGLMICMKKPKKSHKYYVLPNNNDPETVEGHILNKV